MAEYNIERKPHDLKDALDFLVHNRLTQDLHEDEECIKEYARRI
jgi:hypothetical protein